MKFFFPFPLAAFCCVVFLIVAGLRSDLVQSFPAPGPGEYFGPQSGSSSKDGYSYAYGSLGGHQPSNQQWGYGAVEANAPNCGSAPHAGTEVGLIRTSGQASGVEYETKFISAGLEVGVGAMGRASIVDATIGKATGNGDKCANTNGKGKGPKWNLSVSADTGVIFKDGIEAKAFGTGIYIGKRGFQLCIVVCFGYY